MHLQRLMNNGRATGVRVLDAPEAYDFKPILMTIGTQEGWLTREEDTITIHGEDGDVAYRITQEPGWYCCHCGAPQETGREAEQHVRAAHEGVTSPDPQHPAGYRDEPAYRTVREDPDNQADEDEDEVPPAEDEPPA
jgi:hypothetical protein